MEATPGVQSKPSISQNTDNDSGKTGKQLANHNQLVRAKYGPLLFNRNDRFIGRSIAYYGEYSEQEVTLFRQICRPGDRVVEVGANIGAHTLPLARLVGPSGHIYAYEPQRLVFQTLCANMALNSLTQVSCFNCGVGAQAEELTIKELDYTHPANFGGYAIDSASTGATRLPIVRLDDALAYTPVRLLKIDVEGMEQAVIKGAEALIKNSQPLIYLENDRQEKSQALIEFLWNQSYRLYWHQPALFNPANFHNREENIFGNIVSVNMLAIPESQNITVTHLPLVTDSQFHPMAARRNKQ